MASTVPPSALPPDGPGAPMPSQWNPLTIVGGILVVLGFLTVAVGGIFWVQSFGQMSLGLICGFPLFIIGGILLGLSRGSARRSLPPPPPIQRPMVPAGTMGTQELACPNCGAAPRNVDRFGIATCDYCGTRFLVR